MEDGSLPFGVDGGSPDSPCLKSSSSSKEQDRFLPIANVGRIMKKILPGNGKISKDAKETVQECVSEFISFITGEASDKCQREKRKTINGDDIIYAISTLGFEDYIEPLKNYLLKYREIEGDRVNVPKNQRSEQRVTMNQQQVPNQEQEHHMNYNHGIYSPSNMIPHVPSPSFVAGDCNFSLPFSQSLMQEQMQAHEQIESSGHW